MDEEKDPTGGENKSREYRKYRIFSTITIIFELYLHLSTFRLMGTMWLPEDAEISTVDGIFIGGLYYLGAPFLIGMVVLIVYTMYCYTQVPQKEKPGKAKIVIIILLALWPFLVLLEISSIRRY